jgi:hypothetical protein
VLQDRAKVVVMALAGAVAVVANLVEQVAR